MDQKVQRKLDLQNHLAESLKLQKELEDDLRLASSIEKAKLEKQIADQQQQREKHVQELSCLDHSDVRSRFLARIIERNTELNPRGAMQTERMVSLRLDEVFFSMRAERQITVRRSGNSPFHL